LQFSGRVHLTCPFFFRARASQKRWREHDHLAADTCGLHTLRLTTNLGTLRPQIHEHNRLFRDYVVILC
jgi:hypothetical protein